MHNHLVLKGMPKVHESSLGTITSQETIDLTLRDQKLHHLKTAGPTELVSLKGHTLSTTGSIEVDSDKKIAFVTSDISQLKYNEEEMTLLSDYAEIFYSEDGEGLHPKKVELQGNIKIFSQEKEGPTRKGVADTLSYDPVSRTCILKATPGKKVLFTREEDKLSISANEVHITYNPHTKQQEVRGIGHITLSLTPHEQNLLNQVFKHVPSTP
jgi:lipopolysaccharide export system protein LptA